MEFLDVSLDSLIQKKTTIKGKGNDGKRKNFNNKGTTKVVAKAAGPRKFVGKNVLTQPFAVSRRPTSSVSRPSSAISATHNNVNNNNNSVRPSSFVSSTAAAAAAAAAAGGGDGNILNRLGGGNGSIGSGTMITISNLNLDILPRSPHSYYLPLPHSN